jgi:hypothetical protein
VGIVNGSDYDEDKCLAKSELGPSDVLLPTLVAVCDCVPKGLSDAFYSPVVVAVSAMVVPNLLRLMLLVIKYAKIMVHNARGWWLENDVETLEKSISETADIVSNVCVAIDVLSFILNTCIGLSSIFDYFSRPELAPFGDSLCHAAYVTVAVMYKPILLSFFGASVAACDLVYWRSIENLPPATRHSMGHSDHSDKPPLDENWVTFTCMAVVAFVFFLWTGVSITFLPLGLVFMPIVIVFGAGLPALLYGFQGMLLWVEAAIDEKWLEKKNAESAPALVVVKKSFLVKAILAQLVSTVVLLATTSRFYNDTDGAWASAIEDVLELLRALQYDFSFNLNYTFGWPQLPGFAAFQFSLALGVLGLQLLISNSVRLYYGTGANVFGKTYLHRALSKPKNDDEGEEEKNELPCITKSIVVSVHGALVGALNVAVAIDGFVLRRKATNIYTQAKNAFKDKLEKAPTEAGDKAIKARRELLGLFEERANLAAVVKQKTMDLQLVIYRENELKKKMVGYHKTKSEITQVHFIKMLAYDNATHKLKGTFEGVTEVAFSDQAFRDAAAAFLLGRTRASTSELIMALLEIKLPDLKCLRLDGITDGVSANALCAFNEYAAGNTDLVVSWQDDEGNQKGSGSANLQGLQEKYTTVDIAIFPCMHYLRTDIRDMDTWVNVTNINIAGCEHFEGNAAWKRPSEPLAS